METSQSDRRQSVCKLKWVRLIAYALMAALCLRIIGVSTSPQVSDTKDRIFVSGRDTWWDELGITRIEGSYYLRRDGKLCFCVEYKNSEIVYVDPNSPIRMHDYSEKALRDKVHLLMRNTVSGRHHIRPTVADGSIKNLQPTKLVVFVSALLFPEQSGGSVERVRLEYSLPIESVEGELPAPLLIQRQELPGF